jgi:DNA-binding MarR family transcriptional regulator
MADLQGAGFSGGTVPVDPAGDAAVESLATALQSLFGLLKRTRLHDHLLDRAQTDVDRAGLAVLLVLHAVTDAVPFGAGPSLRMTELAEQLHIDAPAVSRKVRQLERAGLIARTRDEADARAVRLRLTAAGREAVTAVRGARRSWLAEVTAGWPAAERAEFARLLGRFAEGGERHLEELDA